MLLTHPAILPCAPLPLTLLPRWNWPQLAPHYVPFLTMADKNSHSGGNVNSYWVASGWWLLLNFSLFSIEKPVWLAATPLTRETGLVLILFHGHANLCGLWRVLHWLWKPLPVATTLDILSLKTVSFSLCAGTILQQPHHDQSLGFAKQHYTLSKVYPGKEYVQFLWMLASDQKTIPKA
jgi:hypothetical protein